MSTTSIRQAIERLDPLQREQVSDERFYGPANFAAQYGVDVNDVRSALREINRSALVTGQNVLRDWLEAVLVHPAMTATEKVAGARVWTFVNHRHLYAWPSQDRLANELGYSRGPNLGKALRRSFEIGAYSPIKIKDLPPEVRKLAVDGSHRSLRSIAYRLNPVDRWAEEAATFASLQNSNMFHGGTLEGSTAHHLNYKGNHQPSSTDSLSNLSGFQQHTSPRVDRLEIPQEGKRHG